VRGYGCKTKISEPPHPLAYARDLSPTGRGDKTSSFSRCGFASELWEATVAPRSDPSPPDLIRRSMLTPRARAPVEAPCRRSFGMDCRIKSGNDERNERERTEIKKIGGETPTDARLFCRAEDGHGRAWIARRTSIGVPPRFSSQGVFHRKGLSLGPGFLGRGGDTFCASL
jgi:hypothetical protein